MIVRGLPTAGVGGAKPIQAAPSGAIGILPDEKLWHMT